MIHRSPPVSSNRPSAAHGRKRCGVRNFVATVQLLLASLALLPGCAGDDEHAPVDGFGGYGGHGGQGNGIATGPCDAGDQRECGYKVGQGTDSVSCYQGVQECVDGSWGPCGEGMIITMPESDVESMLRRRRSEFDPQGVAHTGGTGSTCAPSDLCDPYCYELGETTPGFTPSATFDNSVLCPTTTTLTECAPTPGCPHTPCQTGAALPSALCGACVQAVCALDATYAQCCTTGWTDACRTKAFELKACNVQQQPPMSMCDFGVFSESTLDARNGPVFGPNVKLGSMGDITIQASATTSTVPGQIVTPNDVVFENLNGPASNALGGNWWIGGGLFAASGSRTLTGGYDIHVGKGYYEAGGISITGNVYSSSPYSMRPTSTPCLASAAGCVAQTLSPTTSTKYLDGQNSGTVTKAYAPPGATFGTYPTPGSTDTTAAVPAPFSVGGVAAADTMPNAGNVPARTTCTAGVSPADDRNFTAGTNTLTPGSYGAVSISNAGTVLILDGEGDYFFRSLQFAGNCDNCKLQLGNMAGDYTGTARPTTGNVGYNVAVCNGAFDMLSSTKVYKDDGTVAGLADAKKLTVYVHPANPTPGSCNNNSGVNTCSVNMGNNSMFSGLLIVPDGTFAAGNNVTLNGAVWARAATTDTNFTLTQIAKSDCEGMVTAGTCNTTLPAAATCEEPPITTTGTCPANIVGTVSAPFPAIQSSNWNGITTSMANTKCRSGADCQTNLRCNNVATVPTTGTCTWDKCGSTNALAAEVAACATDPCVQRITAAFPACTPGAWNATCASRVPAVCDAECSAPVGTTTGNCVDNSVLTEETGCAGGYDLAVDYVCNVGSVIVCNHGNADFTGTVPLAWWTLDKRQFAPSTAPTTGTATGTFTSPSVTIEANTCEPITTTTATTGTAMNSMTDYTVMVDPGRSKLECGIAASGIDTRRLDNWSWYNHSYTCTVTPNVAEYDYVADCSAVPDTYPRWRLLRWGAAPGAGQNVRFYAKTDSTVPACTGTTGVDPCALVATNAQSAVTFPVSGSGTAPATAAGFPCALSATGSNCAVNLTSALGLPVAMTQKKNLTIRAEWPVGVTTPTWDVTYTCEFDQ